MLPENVPNLSRASNLWAKPNEATIAQMAIQLGLTINMSREEVLSRQEDPLLIQLLEGCTDNLFSAAFYIAIEMAISSHLPFARCLYYVLSDEQIKSLASPSI